MFLVTISKKIRFITIQEITDRKMTILNKEFDNTFRVYNQAVAQIQIIHVDHNFKLSNGATTARKGGQGTTAPP